MPLQDLATGAVLLLVGLLAYFEARNFDEASRLFPAVTAGLLTLTGLGVALTAVFKPTVHEQPSHSISTPLLTALIVSIWAIAFTHGAGFILPTFLLQLALFRIAGIRNKKSLLSIAAFVAALAYLMFVVLLDVPLPPSRLPSLLQGY